MNPITDTTTVDAAEEMGQVADLVARGANAEARRRTARIADAADPETRALLGEILGALEKHPTVTLPKLRQLWQVNDDDGRALILACVPHAERRAEAAQQADRVARAARAERREYARRAPRDLTTRQTAPRPRRDQRATEGDAVAGRYFADRVDPAETDEQADYAALDYDLAAVPPLRGLPCVAAACGLERTPRDARRGADDGLCEDCRDRGVTGMAILPATATRAEAIAARCDYIAATSATTAERDARLRRDDRSLVTRDRFTVAEWYARQTA